MSQISKPDPRTKVRATAVTAAPEPAANAFSGSTDVKVAARKVRIRRAFDQAGATYEAAAAAQAWAARMLAEDLVTRTEIAPEPRVLEIGCGTGLLTACLLPRVIGGTWLATDLAPGMIDAARGHLVDPRLSFAVLDGENPGEGLGEFDLIVANMTVQWFDDLTCGLSRLARLLRPGGLLAVTAPGAGSFPEWRGAHRALDLSAGLMPLPAAEDLAVPRTDTVPLAKLTRARPVCFPDARAFLRSLRDLGAHTPRSGHEALTPGEMRRLIRFFGSDVTITYQIHFAIWQRRDALNPR